METGLIIILALIVVSTGVLWAIRRKVTPVQSKAQADLGEDNLPSASQTQQPTSMLCEPKSAHFDTEIQFEKSAPQIAKPPASAELPRSEASVIQAPSVEPVSQTQLEPPADIAPTPQKPEFVPPRQTAYQPPLANQVVQTALGTVPGSVSGASGTESLCPPTLPPELKTKSSAVNPSVILALPAAIETQTDFTPVPAQEHALHPDPKVESEDLREPTVPTPTASPVEGQKAIPLPPLEETPTGLDTCELEMRHLPESAPPYAAEIPAISQPGTETPTAHSDQMQTGAEGARPASAKEEPDPLQDAQPSPESADSVAASESPESLPGPRSKRIIDLQSLDGQGRRKQPSRTPSIYSRERKPAIYDPPDKSEFKNFDESAYETPTWLEYRKWNRALATAFLFNRREGETVLLSITPRLLAAAWQKSEGTQISPDEATNQFARTVGQLYERDILTHSAELKILKRTVPDDAPLCTAFLGLAVLAAYEMQTEGNYSANAYYKRLSRLLHTGNHGTELPFNKDDYYALWAYLQQWAQNNKAKLPLPNRDEAARFYVDLALAHVPLRKVDIDRLPAFFLSADFGPGEKPPTYQLETALKHWCVGARRFTIQGMEALSDERCPAVLSQVAHELEAWDGVAKDERGQTIANIELLLQFPNHRPTLTFLAKCPNGFPRTFETKNGKLHTTDGGWYEPAPVLPADGEILRQGFSWEHVSMPTGYALRRAPAEAIAFVTKDSQENGSALVSRSGLLVGTKSAVMCVEKLAALAESYLTQACGKPCRPTKPQGFPENWVLFQGINIRNTTAPPQGLEALAPDSTIRILCSGGLKVGNAYLEGGPPKISVSGLPNATNALSIDGNTVKLDDEGFIEESERFLPRGIHTIKAGSRSRNIEVVESDLAHKVAVSPNSRSSRTQHTFSTKVALPRGPFCVLGAEAGQIVYAAAANSDAVFFECPFPPLWAVANTRRNSKVLCLRDQFPKTGRLSHKLRAKIRSDKKTRLLAARWASTIRMTSHPRLQILDTAGNVNGPGVINAWRTLKDSAKQVARLLRNR